MDTTPTTLVPFHFLKSVSRTYFLKDIFHPPSRSPEEAVQATLEILYAFLSYVRSTCPAYYNPVFNCPTGLQIDLDFAAPRHECKSTAYLSVLSVITSPYDFLQTTVILGLLSLEHISLPYNYNVNPLKILTIMKKLCFPAASQI